MASMRSVYLFEETALNTPVDVTTLLSGDLYLHKIVVIYQIKNNFNITTTGD